MPSEKRHLIIANSYPDDSDIYNYGFLHRRVKRYKTAGLCLDIYRINDNEPEERKYEFDGVTVITGDKKSYTEYIYRSNHDSYLIHFPLGYVIDPIVRYRPQTPIIAWLHGYETLSWHRRWYDAIDTSDYIEKIRSLRKHGTQHKVPFLRRLFQAEDLDIRFVTVSNWFLKHSIEPDAGTRVPNISVIPNIVESDLFRYSQKDPELRRRVLVVKPFTGHKYANDLVVKGIAAFRDSPFFSSVHFGIYGDGPLFEKTLEPLRGMDNVTIVKRFLRQEEIARLHSEYGIFLSPTRWDSQGVSVGEAMSSGLVPVSTAISAIPEFVEHGKSGLLVPPEDPEGLATALEFLVRSPDVFSKLSGEAARQVREVAGPQATTDREIELILNPELGRNREAGEVSWELAYADLENELFNMLNYLSGRNQPR